MAVRDIVKYPDPLLRRETVEVVEITDSIRELVRDLTDTMHSQHGAGIAAIQIGRLERIFLIDGGVTGGDKQARPMVFINPAIIEVSEYLSSGKEGCFSFPGVFIEVERPRWVKLRAMNLEGSIFEAEGDGLFGRALQHEFDHLTGKLMIDRGALLNWVDIDHTVPWLIGSSSIDVGIRVLESMINEMKSTLQTIQYCRKQGWKAIDVTISWDETWFINISDRSGYRGGTEVGPKGWLEAINSAARAYLDGEWEEP